MERRMYWHIYRVTYDWELIGLRLLFSPRMAGNRWLLREQLVKDKRYEWWEKIGEALAKDPEHLVDLAWKLINRALTGLPETIRFYSNVNKIIVYLPKPDFTQSMVIKLARIIEGEIQDLIVPRLRDCCRTT